MAVYRVTDMGTAADIITASHKASLVFTAPDLRDALRLAYIEAELRKLCDKYEGIREPRYSYMECTLDDAPVLVEYEYEGGQQGRTSGPPEDCYENIDPSVRIDIILINGTWISAEGVIAESVIERWTQQILEHEADVSREQYESRMSERDYE